MASALTAFFDPAFPFALASSTASGGGFTNDNGAPSLAAIVATRISLALFMNLLTSWQE